MYRLIHMSGSTIADAGGPYVANEGETVTLEGNHHFLWSFGDVHVGGAGETLVVRA